MEADLPIEIKGSSGAEEIPNVKRQQAFVEMRMSHSGPLPHPSILQSYEAVIPGSAARILTSSEIQAKHRQELESSVIKANILAQGRGLNYAFILALVTIVGGIFLAY